MALIKKNTLKKYSSGGGYFIVIPFSKAEERIDKEFPKSRASTANGYHTFVLTYDEFMSNKTWITFVIEYQEQVIIYKVNSEDINKIKNTIRNTMYYDFDSVFGKENKTVIG